MSKQEMGSRNPEENLQEEQNLNEPAESPKISRRGFLKAAAGAIIGASALGKTAEAFADEKSESFAEKKEQEERQKDTTYLGERLSEISKDGIENIPDGVAIKKNGNMIVHLGRGAYYEISKPDRLKLLGVERLREYRRNDRDLNETFNKCVSNYNDALKRNDLELQRRIKNTSDMTSEQIDINNRHADRSISNTIRNIGQGFRRGDVPEELSDFEQKRIRAKEREK
jgi:hypothetical protein